jgi:multisubunit Na+/H+ antiporter MnhB subunit
MANEHGKHEGNYKRFMAMVGTSTAIMFGLMYLNTYQLDHVMWSETRFWMTFVMGAVMAVVMLAFMWGMYKNRAKNWIIIGVAALTFAVALWLVRSQQTIDDSEYMSAMIPHHSIAILTSERAHIEDKRVQELANSIITAQRKEIAEMKWLLDDIAADGTATTEEEAAARPVPEMEGFLNSDGGATP